MAVIKVGTVEGTGSAINVTLGAVPCYVRLMNIDGLATLEWTEDLADGYGLKEVTNGTKSLITSGGIDPLGDDEGLTVSASDTTSDGDETTLTQVRGFQIGTDTDINVSGETINYVAFCLGHDSD
jgi:hypothetical protein